MSDFPYSPAIAFGTCTVQSLRVLGIVTSESRGVLVRGMDIFLQYEIAPSPNDYWLVELGVLAGGGSFNPLYQHAKPKLGLAKGRTGVSFQSPVAYAVGAVMAARVTPTGNPAPLTGCDVVLSLEEP